MVILVSCKSWLTSGEIWPRGKGNSEMKHNMTEQLKRIRKAYDLIVEQYHEGIDPFDKIPSELRSSPDFKTFQESTGQINCGAADVREYLEPKPEMRFLDAGCSANLFNYRLDKWPSTYYGVDISPSLIKAMERFVVREDVSIGGLWVRDLSKLPFKDNFFHIASVIGVFEYCTLEYINIALFELHRVLKPQSRVVLDIPNEKHPHYHLMLKVEEELGRPHIAFSRLGFDKILQSLFHIRRIDSSQVMLKYFVETAKQISKKS